MAIEIERKYLVTKLDRNILGEGLAIHQGYLSDGPPTVRVRTKGPKAYLTIKSPVNSPATVSGAIERLEFEYEIPVVDALELLAISQASLKKTRYLLANGIEIDLFEGTHDGLILAEFESPDGANINAPPGVEWVEVTDDRRYSNSWLARNGLPH